MILFKDFLNVADEEKFTILGGKPFQIFTFTFGKSVVKCC